MVRAKISGRFNVMCMGGIDVVDVLCGTYACIGIYICVQWTTLKKEVFYVPMYITPLVVFSINQLWAMSTFPLHAPWSSSYFVITPNFFDEFLHSVDRRFINLRKVTKPFPYLCDTALQRATVNISSQLSCYCSGLLWWMYNSLKIVVMVGLS